MISFYRRVYNSVIDIDGKKSKWYVYDRALDFIEKNVNARQKFVLSECHTRNGDEMPAEYAFLHYDRCLLKASVSQFKYYCPVTWKNTK